MKARETPAVHEADQTSRAPAHRSIGPVIAPSAYTVARTQPPLFANRLAVATTDFFEFRGESVTKRALTPQFVEQNFSLGQHIVADRTVREEVSPALGNFLLS